MSKLLINEEPLQVLPQLAQAIGLNEAIILQQIHYWLGRTNNVREGEKWIYNSYTGWQKQFPWWALNTIKRTIYNLEERGLVISDNFNARKMDKTKWYRINYDALADYETTSTQNGPTIDPKWADEDTNLGRAIPETTTETTTETNYNEVSAIAPAALVSSKRRGEAIEVTNAFQARAADLAARLGTGKDHLTSLLKVCRDEPPGRIDDALSYALDYPNARDRTRIFLFRLARQKIGRSVEA